VSLREWLNVDKGDPFPPKGMVLSCMTCRWSEPQVGEEDDIFLQCHRYPPTVAVVEGEPFLFFPQITADDFCAEWRAK
jgi:hypothetical protein